MISFFPITAFTRGSPFPFVFIRKWLFFNTSFGLPSEKETSVQRKLIPWDLKNSLLKKHLYFNFVEYISVYWTTKCSFPEWLEFSCFSCMKIFVFVSRWTENQYVQERSLQDSLCFLFCCYTLTLGDSLSIVLNRTPTAKSVLWFYWIQRALMPWEEKV